MNIERAEILGYCMGVRRAVETAELACRENPDKHIFTLGPLIHNNSALETLEKQGIHILKEDASDLNCKEQNNVVIVRAHGVPPFVIENLKGNGVDVIDATCPRVLSSQKRAADYARRGYTVFLAGDKNHGEVVGISGHARSNGAECIVIEHKEDAEAVAVVPEKSVLLSQTTISRNEYDAIAAALKQKNQNLVVLNTICPATDERQNALVELCKNVDGVLVIGGKHSANTKRLLRTALELCRHAALIETADEIPEEFYRLKNVGLTAGASTPDFVIESVEAKLIEHEIV
ncbi:MAG: 4-hydroxy-3-methylbut-2-enyl diphosphate reductase [Treponemataceae bacterium]|nr:4-hydroxy-3-methylbut-2-enyl diphosphate reductase [Treponemataceae bacterium]